MPGMDGTGLLFEPLIAALPASCPSSVLSYPLDEPLGYDELLPLARKALPEDGPFVLVAESFSGPLALKIAAEAPAGLSGVVLSATFVKNPIWWAPRGLRHVVRATAFRFFARFTQLKALLGGYGTPELQRLLRQANSLVSPAVLASRVRSILAVNVVAELRACSVPILYIRGTHDRVVPEQSLNLILRERPSVQVVRLAGPHLVLQVQAVAAARAIESFSLSAGPSNPSLQRTRYARR